VQGIECPPDHYLHQKAFAVKGFMVDGS